MDSPKARFGIMASGKSYEDVRQALRELGITEQVAARIGLRLYKVGMPWPLEPAGVRNFAVGLEEILIVEERREIIENQVKQELFNWRDDVRPRIVGKMDSHDKRFLPFAEEMTVSKVATSITDRLLAMELDSDIAALLRAKADWFHGREASQVQAIAPVVRTPYFCSGCPHNTSTKVPEGSRALAGIGCHFMSLWMDRNTETFTQMGGEGVPWVGIAPFTREKHIFANLGDGTYFHSGSLAIRAVGRLQGQHHLQDPLQRRGRDDRRPARRRRPVAAADHLPAALRGCPRDLPGLGNSGCLCHAHHSRPARNWRIATSSTRS